MQSDAPSDDAELLGAVDRMTRGDPSALACLFHAFGPAIHALALRIVGDAALAEELTADVFLQAWRGAATYDVSRGSVRTWLMVMLRSRALDALRQRARQALQESPQDAESVGDEGRMLLETIEEHCELHRSLLQLAPVQRQIIALAFFRGYTHMEIAGHLGMPLGSVKTQVRRALRVLQGALAGVSAGDGSHG